MLRTEHQSARMSKIKNGGFDQYGAGPFGQQQFGTAGVQGVKGWTLAIVRLETSSTLQSPKWQVTGMS